MQFAVPREAGRISGLIPVRCQPDAGDGKEPTLHSRFLCALNDLPLQLQSPRMLLRQLLSDLR